MSPRPVKGLGQKRRYAMTRGKKMFVLILSLLIFGCSAATSSTNSGTSLQPKGKINCATIETMTDEERLFCYGGNR
jgi:hypothetical protein